MTEKVILKKIQGFTLMCINMSIGSEITQQLEKRVIMRLEESNQELGQEQNVVPRTSVIRNIVFIAVQFWGTIEIKWTFNLIVDQD